MISAGDSGRAQAVACFQQGRVRRQRPPHVWRVAQALSDVLRLCQPDVGIRPGLASQHEPRQHIPGSAVVGRFHLLKPVGVQKLSRRGQQCRPPPRKRPAFPAAATTDSSSAGVPSRSRAAGSPTGNGRGQVSVGRRERHRQDGGLGEAERHPGGVVAVADASSPRPARTGHSIDAAIRMNLGPVGRQVGALEQGLRHGAGTGVERAQRWSSVASASSAEAAGRGIAGVVGVGRGSPSCLPPGSGPRSS